MRKMFRSPRRWKKYLKSQRWTKNKKMMTSTLRSMEIMASMGRRITIINWLKVMSMMMNSTMLITPRCKSASGTSKENVTSQPLNASTSMLRCLKGLKSTVSSTSQARAKRPMTNANSSMILRTRLNIWSSWRRLDWSRLWMIKI